MKVETVIKASELHEEILSLLKYKELLTHKSHSKVAHFAFVQHYGSTASHEIVQINQKYNDIFIPVLDKVIAELEAELQSL